MNGFNEHLKSIIKEKGLPKTLLLKFIFEDSDFASFEFPISGDDVSMGIEAVVERDDLIYKITEEKLSIIVKYFESLTL